jgi:predicted Ser/Thr protein kinase
MSSYEQEHSTEDILAKLFSEKIKNIGKTGTIVSVENRQIVISDDDGEIITYVQDQWEEDPNIVTEMANNLVTALTRGGEHLRTELKEKENYYEETAKAIQ